MSDALYDHLCGDGPCGLCGVEPARGWASVTVDGETVWLCHDQHMSCYHRWTVYGERKNEGIR